MPAQLYLTYDYAELSNHANKAREVAEQSGWSVTDGSSREPTRSREPIREHDALLLLSGWAYNPPSGPAQHELDWDAAQTARIPRRAILVDETAQWWADKVAVGLTSVRLKSLREKLRPWAGTIGFNAAADSIVPIVEQQLALLRGELNNRTNKKTFVVWDFTIVGLDLILSALEKSPPKGAELQIPGLPGKGGAGQILSDVILPGIQKNDRVLVVTDRPNANVAFELGLALGFGKQVSLVHFSGTVPGWLGKSPLRGHVVNSVSDVNDIRTTLEDPQRWYSPPVSPPVPDYGGTLFLCPDQFLGAALREEQQRTIEDGSWATLTTTLDLEALNRQHRDVSQVVWSIAPYTEGSDSRDGTENAANGIVAGWFFARAFQKFGEDAKHRVTVLQHWQSRDVIDILPISGEFRSLGTYASLLRKVPDQLPPVRPLNLQKIGIAEYEMAEIPSPPWKLDSHIWMGAAPVRYSEYEVFCRETRQELPKYPEGCRPRPDDPVVYVSASDAVAFCKWLAPNCTLPDPELWLYCARAGGKGAYWWGDDRSLLAKVSWNLANSGGSVHEVKKKLANTWGLYDMFGNVDEWTEPYEDEIEDPKSPHPEARVSRAFTLGGAHDMLIESFTQKRGRLARKPFANVGFRCLLFE